MSLLRFYFCLATVFTAWVLWFGGAEWLEGRWASALKLRALAPQPTVPQVKQFVLVGWLAHVVMAVTFLAS